MVEQIKRFSDRVAIVTGAARGIGLAVAMRFAREGATVVIADVDFDAATTAANEVKSAGAAEVWASRCDVSRENEVAATVNGTIERFQRVDVVVNNAGLMIFKPLVEQTEDDWLRVLRVDLLGAFYFIKHGFRAMRPGGSIVNVSSIHAEKRRRLSHLTQLRRRRCFR